MIGLLRRLWSEPDRDQQALTAAISAVRRRIKAGENLKAYENALKRIRACIQSGDTHLNLSRVWQEDVRNHPPAESLPPEIGLLTNLERLYLEDNQLTTLPPELFQLTTLPPEIGQLTNLQRLDLEDNQLTSLPPEIGQLTRLQTLWLDKNQLTSLPAEIGQLTNLAWLGLDGNKLTSLPAEIGQLTTLRHLYLERNQLTSLPAEIGQLTNLKELRLKGNQLTKLENKKLLPLASRQTAAGLNTGDATGLRGKSVWIAYRRVSQVPFDDPQDYQTLPDVVAATTTAEDLFLVVFEDALDNSNLTDDEDTLEELSKLEQLLVSGKQLSDSDAEETIMWAWSVLTSYHDVGEVKRFTVEECPARVLEQAFEEHAPAAWRKFPRLHEQAAEEYPSTDSHSIYVISDYIDERIVCVTSTKGDALCWLAADTIEVEADMWFDDDQDPPFRHLIVAMREDGIVELSDDQTVEEVDLRTPLDNDQLVAALEAEAPWWRERERDRTSPL